jgi:hypothetical protein
VVQLDIAGLPAADGGARGREAAARDRHGRARLVEARRVVVGDSNRPTVVGHRPRDRDVSAEADEHADLRGPRRRASAAVGRESLGGRTQVELDSCVELDRRSLAVEPDPGPAGYRREARPEGTAVPELHAREAAVVAGEAQRLTDGRVDEPVSRGCGRDGDLDRLEQPAADPQGTVAGRRIEVDELRIFSKPAARGIDLGQLALELVVRGRKARGLRNAQQRCRPQRGERDRRQIGDHEVPEVATGGSLVGTGAGAGVDPGSVCFVAVVVFAVVVVAAAACPEFACAACAATPANAPARAAAPKIETRVVRRSRARPASRARESCRTSCMTPPACRRKMSVGLGAPEKRLRVFRPSDRDHTSAPPSPRFCAPTPPP